jgi:hypothetical protein
MDHKSFIVQPFGKYGHGYDLNRSDSFLYQALYVASFVLIGLL